jgi:hypothetical protein
LEVRKRAITNWKKLRIVVVLFQITGGQKVKTTNKSLHIEKLFEKDEKAISCLERVAPYIINP